MTYIRRNQIAQRIRIDIVLDIPDSEHKHRPRRRPVDDDLRARQQHALQELIARRVHSASVMIPHVEHDAIGQIRDERRTTSLKDLSITAAFTRIGPLDVEHDDIRPLGRPRRQNAARGAGPDARLRRDGELRPEKSVRQGGFPRRLRAEDGDDGRLVRLRGGVEPWLIRGRDLARRVHDLHERTHLALARWYRTAREVGGDCGAEGGKWWGCTGERVG